MKKIYALLLLSLTMDTTQACTNVQIKAKDGTLVVGRTLEFGPDLQSRLMNAPREKQFSTTTKDNKPALQWKGRYGFIYADFFLTGHAVDGMNEKGLSFGYLYLPGYTHYPEMSEDISKALPYTSLGDWVLSNFETVSEVEKGLKEISIFAKPEKLGSFGEAVLPVHAVITDKTGQSIVVEFVRGKMVIYQNPLGLLTNAPNFDWHLINLQNYVNLSPYGKDPFTLNGITYSGTGQGSGLIGLPGDPTPPSRFIKTALFQQTAMPVDDAAGAVNLVQHILNTVDIPFGTVRASKNGPSGPDTMDKTWWTVYKDLKNSRFYFKSYDNPTIQYLDMKKLDFAPNARQFALPMNQTAQWRDAMADFMSYPMAK